LPGKSRFVLVHGAWQSAATWDLVAAELEAVGYRVYRPALTGLGPDTGTLTPAVTLDTHVQDVAQVIESEGLQDVVLVGHSYGGMVITAVAEREHARLAHLVYVDAFIPNDGQSVMQLLPEAIRATLRDQATAEGDGWRLEGGARQLDLWGLREGPAREFARSRLCDFSIKCFEQSVSLSANRAATLARTYIACVGEGYPARPAFDPFAARARREGWRYHELPTGHDCHVEMPEAFSNLLIDLA
jgi:pimeloyl-ACP methyl ester carboxylesterase